MKRFDCKAILFDLDGVLVNSNAHVERCWRTWAAQHGLDAETILHLSHGRPTLETMRLVAPHLPVEEEAKRMHEAIAEDFEGIVEVPGVKKLVTALPENRWAVVTSGDWLIAPGRLRHVGLPIPKVMITSDDVVHGKPDPEGYLKAAKQLGFAPEDCVVIEDAIAGIKAARAAGIRVIAVATTYAPSELTEADACVTAMSQIVLKLPATSNAHLTLEIQD